MVLWWVWSHYFHHSHVVISVSQAMEVAVRRLTEMGVFTVFVILDGLSKVCCTGEHTHTHTHTHTDTHRHTHTHTHSHTYTHTHTQCQH